MRAALHWLSIGVQCSECPGLPAAIIDSSMKGECKMKRAVMYFSQAPTDKSFTALQMEFSASFLDGAHVFRLELALSVPLPKPSISEMLILALPGRCEYAKYTRVGTADCEGNVFPTRAAPSSV